LAKSKRLKKWFMLQVWRLQQVAQIITLLLLAINLSLQLFGFIKWRGDALKNPYFTVPLIFLILFAIIWAAAIYWDLRLKMWRDQMAVLVERNPYAKEKMTSKELMLYGLLYIPMMEKLAQNDPRMKDQVETLRRWMAKEASEDPIMKVDLDELFRHIGKGDRGQLDFPDKPSE